MQTIIMVACIFSFVLFTWMLTEAFKVDGKFTALRDPDAVISLFVIAIILIVSVGGICNEIGIWGLPLCAVIYVAWNFLIIPGVKKLLNFILLFY